MREPKKTKETGVTERLIMAMADDMASIKRSTERACIQFQVLAESVGVNVENAFIPE